MSDQVTDTTTEVVTTSEVNERSTVAEEVKDEADVTAEPTMENWFDRFGRKIEEIIPGTRQVHHRILGGLLLMSSVLLWVACALAPFCVAKLVRMGRGWVMHRQEVAEVMNADQGNAV